MSLSSQSQEALAAIDVELKNVFKKKRGSQEQNDLPNTDPGTESEEEEISIKKTEKKKVLIKLSKKKTTESQVIGKKRARPTTSSKPLSVSLGTTNTKKKKLSQEENTTPSSSPEEPQRAKLQRTRSLEVIEKHSPSAILKVSLEKIDQILEQDDPQEVDYKKVKYYLVIVQNMYENLNKAKEFHTFLKNLQNSHATDKALKDIVKSNFSGSTKARS